MVDLIKPITNPVVQDTFNSLGGSFSRNDPTVDYSFAQDEAAGVDWYRCIYSQHYQLHLQYSLYRRFPHSPLRHDFLRSPSPGIGSISSNMLEAKTVRFPVYNNRGPQ